LFAIKFPLVTSTKYEVWSVISFLNANKVTLIEIYLQLTEVYGEKCMDMKNIQMWCKEFSSGCENVQTNRSGRLSHMDATIKKVEELILQNHRVTLNYMAKKNEDVYNKHHTHYFNII